MQNNDTVPLAPALYLIPVPLSDNKLETVLPAYNIELVNHIKHYIVENVRSARRFLKKCNREIDIDSLTFSELNGHTDSRMVASYLDPLSRGESIGVISEAGCPAIADPGADVVALARERGYRVVPLVGPSSIIMSLMASGFNGQSFAFLGYLPIDVTERQRKYKSMQQSIASLQQTQIFIETPYRNNRLIEEMAHALPGSLKLCVASDVTGDGESIITRSIAQWRTATYNYDKVPTIFLLYR